MNLEIVKAKQLYAERKSPEEIAKEIGKSKATIYRWIKENQKAFDEARALEEMSTETVSDVLDNAHKKMLVSIIEDPDSLKDPKVADALIKVANVVEKLGLQKEREDEKKIRLSEQQRGVIFVDDIKDIKED
ncbi:helix-turn-helix domain-containing protein [Cetobacterium somerae]|uniref:helix-turn-helix domain-containing protein n=1 Tax=Cetobacterium somerae TaxID=188913 RepID=UPI00211F4583|nr:helix-turn-helix domain-containing protein [Cetobacterium somerae]MCQ9626894.1 helix-turn-helix domain-containing protein [Cetobacterium somerae]